MNREDVRKLMGGYATGTLSEAEREALFAAALDDQELFDSLMKEEALREVLEDPGAKAQLLAALEKPAAQPAWWSWRPLIGAVAMAGIALTAVAIWRANREKPAQVIVAEIAKQTAPPAPVPPPVVIQPATPAKTRSRTEAKAVRDERRQEKEKDNAANCRAAHQLPHRLHRQLPGSSRWGNSPRRLPWCSSRRYSPRSRRKPWPWRRRPS